MLPAQIQSQLVKVVPEEILLVRVDQMEIQVLHLFSPHLLHVQVAVVVEVELVVQAEMHLLVRPDRVE
jgi:hypothetical protein